MQKLLESEFVSTGAIARSRAYFGRGTGAILLDQVGCTGTETRLVNCSSNPLGVHDCSHFEDAGVTCQKRMYMYILNHRIYINSKCSYYKLLHYWDPVFFDVTFSL